MRMADPYPHTFRGGADNAEHTTAGSMRVYQVWQGSNKFLFGGRLVFGPDGALLFLTLFLIIAPIVVFCVFVAKNFVNEFPHHSGVAIIVVAVAHTIVIVVLLLLTSGRDPGIIPRSNVPPPPVLEEGTGSSLDEQNVPTEDVLVNGKMVKVALKYCVTCKLYRPPRCSHCSRCNNCIDGFDHHCPWVGQCIGRRNYRHFFWFLLTSTLLCLFIIAMCALHIKKLMDGDPPLTVRRALQKSPASVAIMAYGSLATWFVGGLTAFHLYLISRNRTTYENIRYRNTQRGNLYNKGVLRNFQEVLCFPIPPSKVNFRALVLPEATWFVNANLQQQGTRNEMTVTVRDDT
ncbi:hypothetical protein L7F22_033915 [Adiantum nelumboides]|nr:hypothetical protein [Adiantum nelumboides]